MRLFSSLEKTYTKEQHRALEAQYLAHFISWSPVVFQLSRLMIKFGILDLLHDNSQGMTYEEISEKTKLSLYAVKVLLEGSLCVGLVIVDGKTGRFSLSKTGWFLLTDPSVRINIDFNHDVNYIGWFYLEEALKEGRPAGLKHFGDWPTIYEGLSQLPEQVQKSWFAFDHFYSDGSFDQALEIVFNLHPKSLLDVGGNTGHWALRCVEFDKNVSVTIMDLPQQLELMHGFIKGRKGDGRIDGFGINLLDHEAQFPTDKHFDVIWMSQFLDCFNEEEIVSVLSRASMIMDENNRLCIMETLWDRQKYPTAAFDLTMTSLYFSVMANGNSKMYHSDDLERLINKAGLSIESIHDGLGLGHSILVCRKNK